MESNILDIQEIGTAIEMPEKQPGSIAVIGVGGGGCNTINYLISHGIHPEVMLVAANTDAQHLRHNKALIKLQLGKKQDEEIRKLIQRDKILGLVSKKVWNILFCIKFFISLSALA